MYFFAVLFSYKDFIKLQGCVRASPKWGQERMGRAHVNSAMRRDPGLRQATRLFKKCTNCCSYPPPPKKKKGKKKKPQKINLKKKVNTKKIKMFFHAHIFCIAQPTYSKALFPFVTGVHGNLWSASVLWDPQSSFRDGEMKRPMGVAAVPLYMSPQSGESCVSEGHLSLLWLSVQNGFLSRVPMLSVYEFRLFFSLYCQRKYTR